MRATIGIAITAGLLLTACGGSGSSSSTATPTTSAPTTTASPTISALAQGFPEGPRYWTFGEGANTFAAYSERTGDALCLVRFYPEYTVDRGTVSDGPAGQLLDMAARPPSMVSTGADAYSATVTGDPSAALTVTRPESSEVFTATDIAGAAAAVEASLPTADGMMAVTEVPSVCADSSTPTPTAPASVAGFSQGLQYWTTDFGAFGAFSRRTGSAMCLVVLYPESRPDVGTVSDTPAGQEFAIEAKDGGVLFEPQPAQTALVTGDAATGLTLNYSTGFVRTLEPATADTLAALLEIAYPTSDGMMLLQNNLAACP